MRIVARHPIPYAGLPNDIAAAPDGSLFVDTTVIGTPIADFTLAGDLLVIPTFGDNRVVAYRIGEK